MASQCLFTGRVTCLGGDTGEITAELTYGTVSKTEPAKVWSDPTLDPLTDLRGALRLVSGSWCRNPASALGPAIPLRPRTSREPNFESAFSFRSVRAIIQL